MTTERDLFEALRPLYPPDAFALLPQVGNGTGSHLRRHADAIAISLWPSRGLTLEGFEMKCSRGDWLRELAMPEKADATARFCDYWSLVCSDASVVVDGELPEAWGLLVFDGAKLKRVAKPKKLDALPVTRAFVAALARSMQKNDPSKEAIDKAFHDGQAASENGRAQAKIDAFEAASGVKIDDWSHDAEKIGAAVRAVLEGDDAALKKMARLRDVAAGIVRHLEKTLGEKAKPKDERYW